MQLGDAADCEVFSSHSPGDLEDRGGNFLRDEVAPYNALIDAFQGKAARPWVQLFGNHENRIERWLANSVGSAAASIAPLVSMESLLRYRVDAKGRPHRERENFTCVPYVARGLYSHYKITPNLFAIHGWSCAKHASKVHMDQAKTVSIVHGHTHRAQSYTTRNPWTNEIYQAWSPGCLAKMIPLYMAKNPNEWTHGVSVIYIAADNPLDWTHYTIPIQRGRAILPDGREVVA